MENWGRQKWDNQRRSYNKRPPRVTSQPTVPSWEKQFCKVIGSVDWGSIVRTQKFMHLYDNVINWDDSAVEETFHNEKKRFWAKIKGLPCDIPLPDPDLYIDKIDWDNSEIDQGLYSDLENDLVTSITGEKNHEPVIIFGDAIVLNQWVSGWGDEEENFKILDSNLCANLPPTGWGDEVGPGYEKTHWGPQDESGAGPGYQSVSGWGDEEEKFKILDSNLCANPPPTGWGDNPNDGWGNWNNNNNNDYEVGPGYENAHWGPQNEGRAGPGYGKAHWGPRNEGNGGRYGWRNRGSRFRGNDGHRPRNYEGRNKGPFGGEQDKRRNFTAGPPVSHQGGVISNGQTRKQ